MLFRSIGKQIKYLLSHEEIAAAIATKGYECAHKSHTWKHRAVQIMEAVDEGIKSFQTIMDQAVAVSVIVPVHNAQATLAQTLGNLVHQTLQAIEIILVDDASTDNSLEIMKRCEAQFPDKVMIIQLEQNMGAGGARNIGLQYASGQYIGFVDSDDIVDPTMFEKMYLQGIDRDSDLIEVAYYKEETDETILYTDPAWEGELDGEKRAKLIFGAGGYIWSRLFRRELFLGMSTIFRENCILEDCDFMLEVFMRARNITTIQEVLYRYRYFPTSLSRNTDLEYYYKNAMNAMRSIYDRLYLLEGYRQVQAPVEAVICKLYSCTLNQCVKRYLGGKVKGGNKEIADLVECKRKVVSIEIDQNPYLPREMGRLDIELMKAIERVY